MNAAQLPTRVLLMLESSKTICECVTRGGTPPDYCGGPADLREGEGEGGPRSKTCNTDKWRNSTPSLFYFSRDNIWNVKVLRLSLPVSLPSLIPMNVWTSRLRHHLLASLSGRPGSTGSPFGFCLKSVKLNGTLWSERFPISSIFAFISFFLCSFMFLCVCLVLCVCLDACVSAFLCRPFLLCFFFARLHGRSHIHKSVSVRAYKPDIY